MSGNCFFCQHPKICYSDVPSENDDNKCEKVPHNNVQEIMWI
ncbi:hypothetical protein AZ007_000852 [Citrobacter freundii]|nr:hypothetical protein AZ007_000852 [Citrobacter freundii]